MIVAQVQQMKMFNAQLEKEMRAEGRKNRKLVEKVFMPIQMMREYKDNSDTNADGYNANQYLC